MARPYVLRRVAVARPCRPRLRPANPDLFAVVMILHHGHPDHLDGEPVSRAEAAGQNAAMMPALRPCHRVESVPCLSALRRRGDG